MSIELTPFGVALEDLLISGQRPAPLRTGAGREPEQAPARTVLETPARDQG
jgi:hypothetical protein